MDIIYGTQARQKIKDGVNKIAEAVCVTLGPLGRWVIMGKSIPTPQGMQHYMPHITKDGVSVARSIFLNDNLENQGALIVKDAAEKTLLQAGDGTTTACLLVQAIVNKGIELVEKGINPVDLKREIDEAVAKVVSGLKEIAVPIAGNIEKIRQVATVSANNDSAIGDLIAEAFSKAGADGLIDIEESKGVKTTIKITDGYKFGRGWISQYFVSNPAKNECELIEPYILLYEKKLSLLKPLQGILEQVLREGKPLLIICDDAEQQVLGAFVMNVSQGNMKGCIVKCPEFGDTKKDAMEDLAAITGATYISEEKGFSLENLKLKDLGRADKIIIGKDETIIISGKKDKEKLTNVLNDLKMNLVKAEGDDKDKIQKRIAQLQGGIAVLYVGAPTETEMRERKDRCDDAVRATKAAIEEGYVPGGGTAFLRIPKTGNEIIDAILEEPLKRICKNAGKDPEDKLFHVKQSKGNIGYNAKADKIEDLVDAGIIDPVKVLRCSLENAASAAGMIINSDCLTYRVI